MLTVLVEEFEIFVFMIRVKLLAPSINVSVKIDGTREVDLYSVCGTTQGLNAPWGCF